MSYDMKIDGLVSYIIILYLTISQTNIITTTFVMGENNGSERINF